MIKKFTLMDLSDDADSNLIQTQMKVLKLARKIEGYESKKNVNFEVSLSEANSMIGIEKADPLPFLIAKELQDTFKVQLEEYTKI